MLPLKWKVSGEFSGEFNIKYKFAKGYIVEQNNATFLEMYWSIFFKGRKIGSFPKFMYLIFKGYCGKYKSDHGVYSINKLGESSLSLKRNEDNVGLIDCNNSLSGITLHSDGSIPFEHQFVIVFHVWKLIH